MQTPARISHRPFPKRRYMINHLSLWFTAEKIATRRHTKKKPSPIVWLKTGNQLYPGAKAVRCRPSPINPPTEFIFSNINRVEWEGRFRNGNDTHCSGSPHLTKTKILAEKPKSAFPHHLLSSFVVAPDDCNLFGSNVFFSSLLRYFLLVENENDLFTLIWGTSEAPIKIWCGIRNGFAGLGSINQCSMHAKFLLIFRSFNLL